MCVDTNWRAMKEMLYLKAFCDSNAVIIALLVGGRDGRREE